jgi:hypothetical protein
MKYCERLSIRANNADERNDAGNHSEFEFFHCASPDARGFAVNVKV